MELNSGLVLGYNRKKPLKEDMVIKNTIFVPITLFIINLETLVADVWIKQKNI